MNKNSSINISERTRIGVAMLISTFILIGLGIYANYKTVRYKESMQDVATSGIIITQSQDLMNVIMDVQSAYRGYIISNDSSFINSFHRAESFLQDKLASIKKLPLTYRQRVMLDTIYSLANQQRDMAYSIIVKRKYVSFLTAWNFLTNPKENILVNSLRYNILNFINNEKKSQTLKLKIENQNFNKVIYVVTFSVIVAVVIILFTLLYILKIYRRLINTERLLIKSQLRLESILDKLPIGVVVVNTSTNEYHANQKAVELLNDYLIPDGKVFESVSVNDPQYFSGGLNATLRDNLLITRALSGQENIGINETIININNEGIPFRVSATPLYNEKGMLEYAISVFDDISTIKKVENELIEAKKLVEESLKLKQSFLSNMSHEIRTPINSILGFAELLAKKDIGEPENEYVRIIGSAGENLLRLLNDILDFSKLESNMMVFEEHPVSIDGILNSICNLHQPNARNKGIILSYECDDTVPEVVLGDPVRLTQVITNIVGNAIKFTPRGSVLINASLLEKNETYTTVEFKIKDSGIGISKEKLPRVFKRFEQAGAETTRYYGGTGLGLSIAKHIVESQGGKIWATSELGVGSVFTFYMPFKNFDESKFTKSLITEKVLDLSFLTGLKILVVEDNKLNIKLLHGIFMEHDTKIDVAEDGKSALQFLQDNQYDVILMDIELPDISGYEIALDIRKRLKLKVPILALTAHVLAGEKERCIQAGMDDYLTKPVNTKQLFEKISYMINYRKNRDEEISNVEKSTDTFTTMAPAIPSLTAAYTGLQDMQEKDTISLAYLRELSDNNKEFEKEIIKMFLDQTPVQMQELQEAFNTSDYRTLKTVAHKLKSSTAVLVGNKLMQHFEKLEDSAVKHDLDNDAQNSFDIIEQAIQLSIVQLDKILETEY